MRRYSGQKALYEAMSRSGSKAKRKSVLARLRPQLEKLRPQLEKLRQIGKKPAKGPVAGGEAVPSKPAPVVLKPPKAVEMPDAAPAAPAQTWLRPKAIQYNDGRIEVSLPYQIGIIIVLGVVLVVLMGFWFGRLMGRIDERSRYGGVSTAPRAALGGTPSQPSAPKVDAESQVAESQSTGSQGAETQGTGTVAAAPEQSSAEGSTGSATVAPDSQNDHVIVLAHYETEDQLEPVQTFFGNRGIITSIYPLDQLRSYFVAKGLNVNVLPKGDGFLLVSTLCENPERSGTNGYNLRQRIVETGRQYEPSHGFRSFGFDDVYAMKVR